MPSNNEEASWEKNYPGFHVPVATVIMRSAIYPGLRAEAMVARGVITISTDSWLNRGVRKVARVATHRRDVTAHIASGCK